MNIHYLFALMSVLVCFFVPYAGIKFANMQTFFGVFVPYLAIVIFTVGVIRKMLSWAKIPVPFRIPTTCGQQKSLTWIKHNWIDNPTSLFGVIKRMSLEIFLFRSLFRNTKMEIKDGDKISYEWEIWLWVGALSFHYAFLATFIRHFRLFFEKTPVCIQFIEFFDGFLQIGLPIIYLSGVVLFFAVLYLLFRRISIAQVRYGSLAADFFPLFLILGIAGTGIYMRYFGKVDIVSIKELTVGLVTFSPVIPTNVSVIFYIHLFLVCVLFMYFPFSKLMHAGGVFLSPTRNLANNNRMKRHINPWNPDLKFRTYEEYENEFREKMVEAGLPVEKES